MEVKYKKYKDRKIFKVFDSFNEFEKSVVNRNLNLKQERYSFVDWREFLRVIDGELND